MTAALGALPEVVIGATLVIVFAVHLQWFSPIGWESPASMVLPSLALGIPAGGLLARLSTSVVDQAVSEAWGDTWRANGVPRFRLVASIGRRVVGIGAPQLVVVLVTIIGSAVAVEQLFSIEGAGTVAVDAALAQDLPVLQACLAGFLMVGCGCAGLAALVHHVMMRAARGHGDAVAVRVPEPPARCAEPQTPLGCRRRGP